MKTSLEFTLIEISETNLYSNLQKERKHRYYESNKDKFLEYQKEYRDIHSKERNEYDKKYYELHRKEKKEYRDSRREKQKEYQELNKDKIKKQSKEYREIHKEERKEYQIEYQREHKEEIKLKRKEYYDNHKIELKENSKEYYEIHKDKYKQYYQLNKEEILIYHHKYYQDHKEKINIYNKKWREDHKEEIKKDYEENKYEICEERRRYSAILRLGALEHYSDSKMICDVCGCDDIRVLEIDHIKNNGAEHRRKIGKKLHAWLKEHNYPEGYQVLCSNCNFSKEQKLRGYSTSPRAIRYHEIKIAVINHYSNGSMKCNNCDCTDLNVLTMDHINGGGHKHKREIKDHIYLWLKRKGIDYPTGYQVLCMNCQNIKKRENNEQNKPSHHFEQKPKKFKTGSALIGFKKLNKHSKKI